MNIDPGDPLQTMGFETRFRGQARHHLRAWGEVVFWKLYGMPQARNRTTEQVLASGATSMALWSSCMDYMTNPNLESFRAFRNKLFGNPAYAPRETLPTRGAGDVVAPAHHELLDLAPVVRSRRCGVDGRLGVAPRAVLGALAAFSLFKWPRDPFSCCRYQLGFVSGRCVVSASVSVGLCGAWVADRPLLDHALPDAHLAMMSCTPPPFTTSRSSAATSAVTPSSRSKRSWRPWRRVRCTRSRM